MSSTTRLFTALIRTHHITSRKKLQRVKKLAAQLELPFVLVRSGGAPGLMYAEGGDGAAVGRWVAAVHDLRYKDFQCAQKPAVRAVAVPAPRAAAAASHGPSFREVASVAEFGQVMEDRGLGAWWKTGMGYQKNDG